MTRLPINYNNTSIYRIVCKNLEIKDCYVGSTTDFKSRTYDHKSCCNNENDLNYNYYVYRFIRLNGGWENWTIVLIEQYKALDKLDKLKRERYWLEFYNATLNTFLPIISKEESLKRQNEYNKDYRHANKEYFKKYQLEYRQINKEYFSAYKTEYNKINKQKVNCLCGCVIAKYNLSSHIKTNKHKKLLSNKI
jgi:hypothetical protein